MTKIVQETKQQRPGLTDGCKAMMIERRKEVHKLYCTHAENYETIK
jgi:hypothetical protein